MSSPEPRIARPGLRPARLAALVAAGILAVALAACSSGGGATAAADAGTAGTEAVTEFFTILQKPDAERSGALDGFLAPEFQVVRANGDVQDRPAYLAASPTVSSFTITDLKGLVAGDSLVVSYRVETTETIDGVEQTTVAPRLSTFRKIDGTWHLTAHANFGALQ